jgi:endonuclease YncB( thermonuclease family)
MKRWTFLAAFLVAACTPTLANARGPGGPARAVDGDTLIVGGEEVRLYGIDAPELHQTCWRGSEEWSCGAEAASQLARLIAGQNVFCDSMGTDQYRRTLAHCVAGTTDINRTMVSLGHAIAYRRYSREYVSAEMSAQSAKRGIWAGTFQRPDEYRHPRQSPSSAQSVRVHSRANSSEEWAGRARANCNIKGNRNRKGQWIYHLPGMPYYDQTRPEEIFCTESEAQAAGYRRAIVK